MSSGQIERDFGATSDVLTLKRGNTDPRYFHAQTIGCVNFPWLPEPADMPVNGPSIKVVFLDSDGDYGEETCED